MQGKSDSQCNASGMFTHAYKIYQCRSFIHYYQVQIQIARSSIETDVISESYQTRISHINVHLALEFAYRNLESKRLSSQVKPRTSMHSRIRNLNDITIIIRSHYKAKWLNHSLNQFVTCKYLG